MFQAIQKGNLEGAKIHAENSIRQKNQVSESDNLINENTHEIITYYLSAVSVITFSEKAEELSEVASQKPGKWTYLALIVLF